jgi:hypothetical protein
LDCSGVRESAAQPTSNVGLVSTWLEGVLLRFRLAGHQEEILAVWPEALRITLKVATLGQSVSVGVEFLKTALEDPFVLGNLGEGASVRADMENVSQCVTLAGQVAGCMDAVRAVVNDGNPTGGTALDHVLDVFDEVAHLSEEPKVLTSMSIKGMQHFLDDLQQSMISQKSTLSNEVGTICTARLRSMSTNAIHCDFSRCCGPRSLHKSPALV